MHVAKTLKYLCSDSLGTVRLFIECFNDRGCFSDPSITVGCFRGLMAPSEQIWVFLRPDGQSEQILTLGAHACCSPNIFGENFEISSVRKSQIFGNLHQALPPIFR